MYLKELFHEGMKWGGNVMAKVCHEVLLERLENYFALKGNSRELSTLQTSCLRFSSTVAAPSCGCFRGIFPVSIVRSQLWESELWTKILHLTCTAYAQVSLGTIFILTSYNDGLIEWFGLGGDLEGYLVPNCLPWEGTPVNRSGSSEAHPAWPQIPPGMGHP